MALATTRKMKRKMLQRVLAASTLLMKTNSSKHLAKSGILIAFGMYYQASIPTVCTSSQLVFRINP